MDNLSTAFERITGSSLTQTGVLEKAHDCYNLEDVANYAISTTILYIIYYLEIASEF